MVQLMEDGKRN